MNWGNVGMAQYIPEQGCLFNVYRGRVERITSRKNVSYDAWFLGASEKCQGILSTLVLIEYF